MDKLDDLTKILLTAGGTLTVGLVVGIVTWAVQSYKEHAKWVREKRYELYSEISQLASTLFVDSQAPETVEDMLAKYRNMHGLVGRLRFVGPEKVWKIAAEMVMEADLLRDATEPDKRSKAISAFGRKQETFATAVAKTLKFK